MAAVLCELPALGIYHTCAFVCCQLLSSGSRVAELAPRTVGLRERCGPAVCVSACYSG